jgi:ATP-dependent RNA helicase DDX51/DBP6
VEIVPDAHTDEEGSIGEVIAADASPVEDKTRKDKRPKKRQKVVDNDGDVEMQPQDVITVDPDSAPSASLPTLPSFPLPALPDAPSKSVLALQGLDRALVGAEIVDATGLLRIPPDGEDDGGTGLHEKTRKRLLELGIVELFAGESLFNIGFIPDSQIHQCKRVYYRFFCQGTRSRGPCMFLLIHHVMSVYPPRPEVAKLWPMCCLSWR